MRTVFIHGEIEQFLESRAALIDRFTSWCTGRQAEFAPALVGALLDDKLTRDGLLARWSEQDLERFLVDVVPRRVALESGWSVVPELLHRWVDFLSESGLLMSASPPAVLHEAVDRCVQAYLEAMAEPSEWGSAKFWSVVMAEHGVDTGDESAVERFLDGVDSGVIDVDDGVLDLIEEREELDPAQQPAFWLPPVSLPDADEHGSGASETGTFVRVRALLEWVGRGRRLDEEGELAEADRADLSSALGTGEDLFQVDLLLAWARRAHLVRTAGDHLVCTRISEPLLEEPDLLWRRLWEQFVLLDEVFAEGVGGFGDPGAGAEVFVAAVTSGLRMLYSYPEPLPLELMVAATVGGIAEEEGALGAGDPDTVREMLRGIFEQWELMGALRVFPTEDAETIEVIDSETPEGTTPDHTMVELLPFGTGAVRGSLQAVGYTAPTVRGLAGESAEVAVLSLAQSAPEAGDRVLESWVGSRGSEVAAAELAALLRGVDDPLVRLGALSFMEHTGAEGVEAMRGLVDDPVAGAAARMWLSARDEGGDVAVRTGDETLVRLDSMSVAATEDADSFLAELRSTPTTNQIALVEEIVRAPHARRDTVLEVIAEGHPDKRVAKVARRSLDRQGGV